mmetsp:Transcript_26626/g.39556  ORF Transcript_26626/g.39556 Transcript_26626/m.39556 type:complete len:237 (+) Transcript_26626:185-895(+)|eukprot:CAMPEP_0185034536 /NCGR_PEP_ID=MMETSP1103-20130426/24518_1 /TAXON_ID=36769 /ORGANISM="Paraphysomonas bandaiensis, Strain Caron Lab Isolate" /LENGTH=236 /DNA_ID=CAMNT_0027571235 /DNA_START=76 /DNA_END=786 /DNA_ORIENTATION=+
MKSRNKPAYNWRDMLNEKLSLVQSLDSKVKEKAAQMDREFDVLNMKHKHEEWLDTFHQRLARIEMDLREKESHIPAIHNKTVEHDEMLKRQQRTLKQMFGDKLDQAHQHKSPHSPITANGTYLHEGWLTETGNRTNRRKYFKLAPATSTAPVRLYGYDSDIAKAAVSIIQIPRKSTVTQNSATRDYSYSFQLRTTDSVNKTFICDTAAERDTWISVMSDEIKSQPQNTVYESYSSP